MLEDQLSVQVVTNKGESTPLFFTYPLAGVDYPLKEWTRGDIVRGQYDFFLSNLEPGIYRLVLSLNTIDAVQKPLVITRPFRVEH